MHANRRLPAAPAILLLTLALGGLGCAGLLDDGGDGVATTDTAKPKRKARPDTASVRVAREEERKKRAAAARKSPAQLAAEEDEAAKRRITVIHGGGSFTGVDLRCPGFSRKADLTGGQAVFDDVPTDVNCVITAQGGMPGSIGGQRAGSVLTCMFNGPDFRCR
jgi:hypothetical protein